MLQKIKSNTAKWFIHFFGDIQIRPQPMFLTYAIGGYKLKGYNQREIINKLKKGDILLRRWDYYITNWFIPGYWVHAGVYVGNNKVIHSTPTKGVHESDILDFMRADGIMVLRIPKRNNIKGKLISDKAKRILGKKYDYTFNGKENSKYYCFEVVAHCLQNISGINLEIKNIILAKDIINSGLENIYEFKK